MTLDDLRKIAEAAPKGVWEATTSEATMNNGSLWRIARPGQPKLFDAVMPAEVARFIATFNPARVLELLDWQESVVKAMDWGQAKIDRLEARLAAVEKLHYPALMPKPRGGALKVCAHCARQMHAVEKRAVWPCPTIKEVRGD